MMQMPKHIPESILDAPRDDLCQEVWNTSSQPPALLDDVQQKLDNLIDWAQSRYHFNNLSVYIIGSICSNSYSDDSDIDIDFCALDATENDNDEKTVKEFAWNFKKDFIDNYQNKFPDQCKAGNHPFEVYFSPNPFQCFMSVGCYNVLERKWEVGPQMKNAQFDPISEYYNEAMKQVKKILKDIRNTIFNIYEIAFACKKSNDLAFKDEMHKSIVNKLDEAAKLFYQMKDVRSNFQRPCKSKEEALKRRENKKRHVVDAAFKFLDKFGYISILKDFIQLKYDIEDDESALENIDGKILKSVSSNMQLKHLQDSNDANDQKFVRMMHEADGMLEENASNLVKISFIAGLMAMSSLLPVNALTKSLTKAKQQNSHLTINSKQTKKAIADAAIDKEMIGPMSKTNVVNAVARCLWEEGRGKKEGTAGREAIASVIVNRTGNRPEYIIDVIKQPSAFSYTAGYVQRGGGWTDSTYKWFLPYSEISKNPANKELWDECNRLALQIVNGTFNAKVLDKNYNAYLNKKTASKKNVDSWGKQCNDKIGSHHFGYVKDRDPKYVVPGTYTSWKKMRQQQDTSAKTIVVKAGDTLSKIAKENNTTLAKLIALNKDLKNINSLRIGQKIRIS